MSNPSIKDATQNGKTGTYQQEIQKDDADMDFIDEDTEDSSTTFQHNESTSTDEMDLPLATEVNNQHLENTSPPSINQSALITPAATNPQQPSVTNNIENNSSPTELVIFLQKIGTDLLEKKA